MKVTYFAHSVLCRGGDKMILAHLNHLVSAGHNVTIRAAVVDTAFTLHEDIVVRMLPNISKFGTLSVALLTKQEADCIIASIAPTAAFLSLRNRGRVLHYAQDDNETAYRCSLIRFLIRLLYFLIFSIFKIPTITVSRDLAEMFRDRYGVDCITIGNGVDEEVFFPSSSSELIAEKQERKSVVIFSRKDFRKGYDIACQTIARLAETSEVPIEVWTIGGEVLDTDWGSIPYRHFGHIDEQRLRTILSSADVLLYPSRSEGFGLLVLEAFACNCPVVTSTAVTFARHGENALVGMPGDVETLAAHTRLILGDDQVAKRIAEGGHRFSQKHTLADSTMHFEQEISLLFG